MFVNSLTILICNSSLRPLRCLYTIKNLARVFAISYIDFTEKNRRYGARILSSAPWLKSFSDTPQKYVNSIEQLIALVVEYLIDVPCPNNGFRENQSILFVMPFGSVWRTCVNVSVIVHVDFPVVFLIFFSSIFFLNWDLCQGIKQGHELSSCCLFRWTRIGQYLYVRFCVIFCLEIKKN